MQTLQCHSILNSRNVKIISNNLNSGIIIIMIIIIQIKSYRKLNRGMKDELSCLIQSSSVVTRARTLGLPIS